jgi:hypothetical protein
MMSSVPRAEALIASLGGGASAGVRLAIPHSSVKTAARVIETTTLKITAIPSLRSLK